MREAQTLLDLHIPAIQLCPDSTNRLLLPLQQFNQAGRVEIQESLLSSCFEKQEIFLLSFWFRDVATLGM